MELVKKYEPQNFHDPVSVSNSKVFRQRLIYLVPSAEIHVPHAMVPCELSEGRYQRCTGWLHRKIRAILCCLMMVAHFDNTQIDGLSERVFIPSMEL